MAVAQRSFNKHRLINFEKLLRESSKEILRLQNEFETHGWCFVQLPNHENRLTDKLSEVEDILAKFFSRSPNEKSQFESPNAFGYSHVGHKEGVKVLINRKGLGNFHRQLPEDVEQILRYLAELLYSLTKVIKTVMFKMPALAQSQNQKSIQLSSWRMLDIVNYYNRKRGPSVQPKVGFNTDEVNCVPHFDPGLFSLSILSTCEGLQLSDLVSDTWIDGPNISKPDHRSIGVIWLGEAASILTNNRFKSGIHRVVYPSQTQKPRLTIWQEICTKEQINPLVANEDSAVVAADNPHIRMINQPNSLPLPRKSVAKNRDGNLERAKPERRHSARNGNRRRIRQSPPSISTVTSASSRTHYSDSDSDDDSTEDSEPPNTIRPHMANSPLAANSFVLLRNQPNSVPLQVKPGGESVNDFMKRVENERGLSVSKTIRGHIGKSLPPVRSATNINNRTNYNVTVSNDDLIDAAEPSNSVRQSTANRLLPANAFVTLKNQPNSVPLQVNSNGESVNDFMKRVENERGLSVSKVDVRHFSIEPPMVKKATPDKPKKKSSFFSKLLK